MVDKPGYRVIYFAKATLLTWPVFYNKIALVTNRHIAKFVTKEKYLSIFTFAGAGKVAEVKPLCFQLNFLDTNGFYAIGQNVPQYITIAFQNGIYQVQCRFCMKTILVIPYISACVVAEFFIAAPENFFTALAAGTNIPFHGFPAVLRGVVGCNKGTWAFVEKISQKTEKVIFFTVWPSGCTDCPFYFTVLDFRNPD